VRVAAAGAASSLIAVAAFQLALALGAPLGHAAWGGAQAQLPAGLRIASGFAAAVLVLAAFIVLGRAGYRVPIPPNVARGGTWVLVAALTLSALGNFASSSNWERFLLGPVALVQALLCLVLWRAAAADRG
jgi:hypothetical protein